MSGRIAFLLSGSGSTLRNLLAEIEAGRVAGQIVVVISDRPGVGGLAIAAEHGIDAHVVSRKEHKGFEAYSSAIGAALAPYDADLVVSGGFLTLFKIPAALENRMVNVHPSLLPAFGGKGCWGHHVHEKVLASGVRFTGCTVHFVTDEVDGGPIVDQALVDVRPDDTVDTLAARVQAAERELYPRCIAGILDGSIRLVEGRVVDGRA
ncbi:MAG: phosphoribosylglycinamide formyltransferase [Planctomycetota bacterium]|nr:phosphoribosylglycinamide formyltransferase [Planctomycetota bacterium]